MRKDNFFEHRNFERLLIIIYLSVILNGTKGFVLTLLDESRIFLGFLDATL